MTPRSLLRSALQLVLLVAVLAPVPAGAAGPARKAACGLDQIREILVGIEAAAPDDAAALIRDNTAAWQEAYNRFAIGPEAAELRGEADAIEGRPSRSQCRALLPFAAVAESARRVSAAGGTILPGALLVTCADGDGLCVTEETARLLSQCRVRLFDLPWQRSC